MVSLITALRSSLPADGSGFDKAATDIEITRQCRLLVATQSNMTPGKVSAIPILRIKGGGSLSERLHQRAVQRALKVRQQMYLDEADLQEIWDSLESQAHWAGEMKLSYEGFAEVAAQCRELFGPQCDPYFKPSVFLRFDRDGSGAIPVLLFEEYLTQLAKCSQMRSAVAQYDRQLGGFLDQQGLEQFISDTVMGLPCMVGLQSGFLSRYLQITSRKIMLFVGHHRKVRLRDLVVSGPLQELMALKYAASPDDPMLIGNWFSLQSASRVYTTFTTWDRDMTNTLSIEEFSNISQGQMSPLFLQRVFQEHVMKQCSYPVGRQAGGWSSSSSGEMDLMAFVDFVLSWDNRGLPVAQKYFWDIYDIHKRGYLTPADVYTFFKEIRTMWLSYGYGSEDDVRVEPVMAEILDMVSPAQPPNITFKDLQKCGLAEVIFAMLANVQQYLGYVNRESLMQQEQDE